MASLQKLVVPAALLATVLLATFANAAKEEVVEVAGHVPDWANQDRFVSRASPSSTVHARLHVGYRKPEAVDAYAAEVSDPDSPLYGKYLSTRQFKQRFAPTDKYMDFLTSWAGAQGFGIAYRALNNKYIALEGTVEQFSKALHTSFGLFKVKGKQFRAPLKNPSLPARLFRGYELLFLGLDQSWALDLMRKRYKKMGKSVAAPGPPSIPPGTSSGKLEIQDCIWTSNTTYAADPAFLVCGYRPSQIRSAYSVPSNLDGTGQTVAIIDAYASPYIQSDLDTFSLTMDLPNTTIQQIYPPFTYNKTESLNPGFDPGWQLEETLDIETVHGLAPKAKIIYLAAKTPTDADLQSAINYVLEKKLAPFISNSYGAPLYGNSGLTASEAANVKVVEALLKQAAVLGIGVYFSSGDSGDDSTTDFYEGYDDVTTPDYYAASPNAIAVGGTTLAIGAGGKYIAQYGWGENAKDLTTGTTSFSGGSGGGVAYTFPTPSYQANSTGVKAVLAATKHSQGRVVPDVSAVADSFTGYIVGASLPPGDTLIGEPVATNKTVFQYFVVGGTSLACPVFVALMALQQQRTGMVYGFANPLFYKNHSIFLDVKPAAQFPIFVLATTEYIAVADTTLKVHTGYDNVTGLGTPGPAFWTLPVKK